MGKIIPSYKTIRFISKDIAHFPTLTKAGVTNGFSWGKNAGNMSFSFGNKIETKLNLMKFFTSLSIGKPKDSVNMVPEHKDRIVDLTKKLILNLNNTNYSKAIECDALITDVKNQVITVKPADCTTTIIYARSNNRKLIGLVHSGWKGVDLSLPHKVITHILDYYRYKQDEIKIFVLPGISKDNRSFKYISNFTNQKYIDKYMSKRGELYYFDQQGCAIDQYVNAGIPLNNLYVYDIDTYRAAKNGETFSDKLYKELIEDNPSASCKNGRFIVAVKM